jgi:acetyl esterase/lipase
VYSRDEAKVVDCVADAQDAMVFVRKNAASLRIDPDRIVAAGGSAGGHLAAAVATLAYRGEQIDVTPADYRPNGLILFNPAVALADFDGAKEEAYFNKTELVERLGDKPEALSPLHHVTPELPPTLILHGEADITVPIWTVEAFRERATNAGVDCLLVAYPDQVHGFFNFGKAGYEPTLESMLQFLRDKKFMHALPE